MFDLGQRIRDARKQQRMTLQRVAGLTGLSVGFLSQVERNITRPSLASLTTIARALDATLSALLHQPDLPTAVSRGEGRVAYMIKDSAGSYERLSTTYPTQMLNALKIGVPGGFASRVYAFEGEAVIYVLTGTVRYVIEGVIYELQADDSLHFSTSKPHQMVNPAEGFAEILVLSTQQLFDEQHRVLPQLLAVTPHVPGRKNGGG